MKCCIFRISGVNLLPEAICCLQTCDVAGSEVMVGDTCVPCRTVINTTINQLPFKDTIVCTDKRGVPCAVLSLVTIY